MNTMGELEIRGSSDLTGQKGDGNRQRFGFSLYKRLSSMEWVYGPIFAYIFCEVAGARHVRKSSERGTPLEHGKHEITVNARCLTAVRLRVRLHTRQRIRCNGGLRRRAKQHHV